MQIRCVQPECEPLKDELRAATRADTPPRHMIELHAHLHALRCSSRSPHTARRQYPSRKRAGPAAASRQARAATLCRHTCGMLESYAVVSMCRSAEVSGRDLALRDAHQTSSQGASWPGDEVRATSHRPHRFAAEICADLLGALDGGTTHARTLYAFSTGPGRAHTDDARPWARLGGTVVRCRRQPWKVPAQNRVLRIGRCRNEFLLDPLLVSTVLNCTSTIYG